MENVPKDVLVKAIAELMASDFHDAEAAEAASEDEEEEEEEEGRAITDIPSGARGAQFFEEFGKESTAFSPFPNGERDFTDAQKAMLAREVKQLLKDSHDAPSGGISMSQLTEWWRKKTSVLASMGNEGAKRALENLAKADKSRKEAALSMNVNQLEKEIGGLQEFMKGMGKEMRISGWDHIGYPPKLDEAPSKKIKKKIDARHSMNEEARRQELILGTQDIWICEICEYEKVFGEKPREMIKWYAAHNDVGGKLKENDVVKTHKNNANGKKKKKKKKKGKK